MNDAPESAPVVPTAPVVPVAPVLTPKKPKIFRWWGIYLLLGFAVLFFVVLPFIVNPWVLGKIRTALAANGWELTPESQLSFSLYGATLHGDQLVVRMIEKGKDGSQEQVATASRLHAEVAIFSSLTTNDVVIQELAIEGMSGNLRRGPDGRIATLPPPTPEEEKSGTDYSKIDWVKWYEKAMEKYKQRQEEQAKQKTDAPSKPTEAPAQPLPPQSDPEWPKATKHQPTPKADRHVPRVIVRKLAISGTAVKLPDESAFEITKFTVNGTNVAMRQDVGETMILDSAITTKAAGDVTLALQRKADETGNLVIKAPAVPVEALAGPGVSGDRLAPYGATGLADLAIDLNWTNWDLLGSITSTITGLKLTPTASDSKTQQVAQAVNALKGKPIAWPVKLGGTLMTPKVTDTGVEAVLKGGVLDAAKGIAGEKATEQLNKQLDKNPEAKAAADKAKGALNGLFNK